MMRFVSFLIVATICLTSSLSAAEENGSTASLLDKYRGAKEAGETAKPQSTWPWIEWHGYFRNRGILLTEADLGTYDSETRTGTSLVRPSLLSNPANSSGEGIHAGQLDDAEETTIGWASMRLRLQPTIHVWDRVRINTTVDLFDNMVFGTSPDFIASSTVPIVPIDTMTRTQVARASDNIALKEAWVEWLMSFDDRVGPTSSSLGLIRVGRFANHWGMGILYNRGDYLRNDPSLNTHQRKMALDADSGSYADRIDWTGSFGEVNLRLGYSWMDHGTEPQWGTARELSDTDDLRQVEFSVFKCPDSLREFEARRKALYSGDIFVDWGLLGSLRTRDNGLGEDGSLFDENAWVVTPDLWVRIDWRPEPAWRFMAQMEGALHYGQIDQVSEGEDSYSMELLSFGAALETLMQIDTISFGLDAGLASGDSHEIMLAASNENKASHASGLFAFNQDYIVDMLLYREVLGGVMNSAYVKPHFAFDVLPSEQNAFGGRFSGLWAMAMNEVAWPGDSLNLGLELSASMFYEEANRFLGDISLGALFPFGARDRASGYGGAASDVSSDAVWAWTLQGRLNFVF